MVVAVVSDAVLAWVVVLVLALVLAGNGLSSGPTAFSGATFGASSDAERRAQATRSAFPARKRFADAPAEYDEAAWKREKARRAADRHDDRQGRRTDS